MGKSTEIKMRETSQCYDARNAHVQITINKTNTGFGRSLVVWVNVDDICRLRVYAAKSISIEDTRTRSKPDPENNPVYVASPFSGVVGCGIHRVDNPQKIVCLIPALCPAELKDKTREELKGKFMSSIKKETEKIAAIICKALNEVEK